MAAGRFVEWDQLDIRVNGAKLNETVRSFGVPPPLESLRIDFQDGLMRISGSIRKFVSIPFSVDVRDIHATGKTVRVPLHAAAAFGGIPVPRFLFGLAQSRLPDAVRFEEPATLVVSLDHFLPEFVDAEVQRIWIVDGGLAVTLGRGGADLPPIPEGQHGADTERSDGVAQRRIRTPHS
jgi:hypothetical protein